MKTRSTFHVPGKGTLQCESETILQNKPILIQDITLLDLEPIYPLSFKNQATKRPCPCLIPFPLEEAVDELCVLEGKGTILTKILLSKITTLFVFSYLATIEVVLGQLLVNYQAPWKIRN